MIADHHDVMLDQPDHPNSRTLCGHLELDDGGGRPFYPWGANDGKVMDSELAGRTSFAVREIHRLDPASFKSQDDKSWYHLLYAVALSKGGFQILATDEMQAIDAETRAEGELERCA